MSRTAPPSVSVKENLVFDVGMHTGEDTARFLSRGLDVVAVEANPELVESAQEDFGEAIRAGRLTIVNSAIAEERGTASFGIADLTIWSSLDPRMIARNENLANSRYHYVDVPTVPFADVLGDYGVPFYLKVDIEGYDMLCVRALRAYEERPRFISIESNVTVTSADPDAVFDEIAELWTLGYRRFRYVDQSGSQNTVPSGEQWDGPAWHSAWSILAQAQWLRLNHNVAGFGGKWTHLAPAKAYGLVRRKLGKPMKWYDLHAALPQ
jgi:FkbM family methyltransferase